jgi:hypothetical protein
MQMSVLSKIDRKAIQKTTIAFLKVECFAYRGI